MRHPDLIKEDIRDLREWLKPGSLQRQHHISYLRGRSIEEFNKEYERNIGYQISLLEKELNQNKMDNCSKHKKEVAGISDMKVLAEMIGDLHYETLAELIHGIRIKIFKDAKKDLAEGREQLASSLLDANLCLHDASVHITKAWQISKPFMKME